MLTQKILAFTTSGSDWILYFLIFLSICSLAIIIERFLSLRGTLSQSQRVTERAKEALKANDLSVLEDISKNHDALEGRLLTYALRYCSNKGSQGIEEVMTGYMLMEKPGLEKNLGFLATLGNNAPFIGL